METKPTSPCRLCGALGSLRDSHIISKFYVRGYASTIVTGSHGQEQPASILISTVPGIESGQKQHGIFERELGVIQLLLCADCEQRFSRYEDWFRRFFYGTRAGKIQKQPVGNPVALRPREREVLADYKPFKLFILSLLWRVSVADGVFFRNVRLTVHDEKRIATVLLSESPGPDDFYGFAMLDLRIAGCMMEDMVEEPAMRSDGSGNSICTLFVGGFSVVINVSDGITPMPHGLAAYRVRASGRFTLVEMDDRARQAGWFRKIREMNALPVIQ